jgi:phage terminase small subunit
MTDTSTPFGSAQDRPLGTSSYNTTPINVEEIEPLPELKPIELIFCHEYAIDLNGTKAGIRSGFKGSSNTIAKRASDYLKKPHIRAYLCEILQLNAATVITELCRIAFANLTDVVDYNSTGITYKNSGELSDRAKSAIKSIRVSETFLADGGSTVTTQITMHDKTAALDKLMRKLRLYPSSLQAIDAMKVLAADGMLLPEQMDAVQGGLDTIRTNMQAIANERATSNPSHQGSDDGDP